MQEHIIYQMVIIMAIAIGAQWFSWIFRLPSILLLLLGGLLVGPVFHIINPDELFGNLLFPLVSVSVALILFEGGLTLRVSELPRIGGAVRNLITIGMIISWLTTALAARYILHFDTGMAVLLGAILVVTGPTVVLPLLNQIRPTGNVGSVLRWEGIVIDPIGALLTVLVFEILFAGNLEGASAHTIMAITKTVIFGPALGLAGAVLFIFLLRRFWLPDFLQNTFVLALVVGVFFISNEVQPESGLLAVTVMGLALANQRFVDVKHVVEFKENLRILLISLLFVVLGARIRLEDLTGAGWGVVIFVAILIVIIRPISVYVSTLGSPLSWRERTFAAFLAPRGIVAAAISSIFALYLEQKGYVQAQLLVSTTFIVIISTVAIYGLSAAPLARFLGVADQNPQGVLIIGAQPWIVEIARILMEKGFKVFMVDTNRYNTLSARMAGIPTYTGNIVSEHTLEEIELGGLGKVLAMTANSLVNFMAVQQFAHIFGKSKVYQLAPGKESSALKVTQQHLYGRTLFGEGITFSKLHNMFLAGAVVKATSITKEFDFTDFQKLYGESAVPLFIIKESGSLIPISTDISGKIEPGNTIISLVLEKDKDKPA